MNGWMGSIIRVNLTNETFKTEPLNTVDAKLYLGGRGLGAKIYMDEVDPKADALGPENKLIFITGPLTGTLAASAGRYEVVTKSPLSGTIEVCSPGGHFGPELKYAGYDGIILEGKAQKPLYLYINNEHLELRDAGHIWSKEVPATTVELLKETEEDAKVACIGPAGKKPVLSVEAINDREAAGGSGLGSVMAAKNLKAIVVKGTQSLKVAKKKPFLDSCMNARAKFKTNPVTGCGLPSYCFGCAIGCAGDKKIPGQRLTNFGEGPEYEAGWLFWSDGGVNDLAELCEPNLSFQDLAAVADSAGICHFTVSALGLPEIAQMIRTCTGVDYTDEEILQIGERIWNLEKRELSIK